MVSKIRSDALDLLARREHSKFELQHKLGVKGFVFADIAGVIQELINQNLQSDLRFVESYIKMRCQRGFGPLRIKSELQQRGIDRELSKKFLDESNPNWFKLAIDQRCKKFGKKIPDDLSAQAKQMRYLYYKGFATDQIRTMFKTKESKED